VFFCVGPSESLKEKKWTLTVSICFCPWVLVWGVTFTVNGGVWENGQTQKKIRQPPCSALHNERSPKGEGKKTLTGEVALQVYRKIGGGGQRASPVSFFFFRKGRCRVCLILLRLDPPWEIHSITNSLPRDRNSCPSIFSTPPVSTPQILSAGLTKPRKTEGEGGENQCLFHMYEAPASTPRACEDNKEKTRKRGRGQPLPGPTSRSTGKKRRSSFFHTVLEPQGTKKEKPPSHKPKPSGPPPATEEVITPFGTSHPSANKFILFGWRNRPPFQRFSTTQRPPAYWRGNHSLNSLGTHRLNMGTSETGPKAPDP